MIAVLNWGLVHWYVFFWLAIFGVFEGVRDFFIDIAKAIGGIGDKRHKRKLQLARAEAKVARAKARPTGTLPAAPCRHRNVVSVRNRDTDKVVAWLCQGCDMQLPAEFSVYEEDL